MVQITIHDRLVLGASRSMLGAQKRLQPLASMLGAEADAGQRRTPTRLWLSSSSPARVLGSTMPFSLHSSPACCAL